MPKKHFTRWSHSVTWSDYQMLGRENLEKGGKWILKEMGASLWSKHSKESLDRPAEDSRRPCFLHELTKLPLDLDKARIRTILSPVITCNTGMNAIENEVSFILHYVMRNFTYLLCCKIFVRE